MNAATRKRLRELDRAFYDGDSGDEFSATRSAPWAGWGRLLPHLPKGQTLSVLDLACGNGRLYGWLHDLPGKDVRSLGIDQSARLLELATARYPNAAFRRADLLAEGEPCVELFDLVCLFGMLHHVPGRAERVRLVQRAAARCARGGVLALTFWRFDRDPRLARRRLGGRELERHGVAASELDEGDVLLAFGAKGRARYCHLHSDAEIAELAAIAGGEVLARYAADGRGDHLNDYLLVRPGGRDARFPCDE
jgi:SAM-dependent methyltransferase